MNPSPVGMESDKLAECELLTKHRAQCEQLSRQPSLYRPYAVCWFSVLSD